VLLIAYGFGRVDLQTFGRKLKKREKKKEILLQNYINHDVMFSSPLVNSSLKLPKI
jgi:hypothetical protein